MYKEKVPELDNALNMTTSLETKLDETVQLLQTQEGAKDAAEAEAGAAKEATEGAAAVVGELQEAFEKIRDKISKKRMQKFKVQRPLLAMCTSTSTQLPRTIELDPWATDEFKAAVTGSAECLEWLRNEALLNPDDLTKSIEIEGETQLAETVGAEGQGEGVDGAAAEAGGDEGGAEKKEGEGKVEAGKEAEEGKEGEEGTKDNGAKKLFAADDKKARLRMNKLMRPTKDTPCVLRPLIQACRDGLADVCGVLCQGLSDEQAHKGVADEGRCVLTKCSQETTNISLTLQFQ